MSHSVGRWRKMSGQKVQRQTLCTPDADPPVMFNPISSAVPPDCISKTRRPGLPSNTTLPGTCASMVTARSMQIAEPVHILVVKLYTPAATKILSTALLLTAAVRSATVLTETCPGGEGGEGGGEGGEGGGEGDGEVKQTLKPPPTGY